jgi:threonine aldolase
VTRTFRSDNNAGLCPEAVQAICDANRGHEFAYGDDRHTEAALRALRSVLTPETRAWFVATGTAANTLAIAAMIEPWQKVICHEHSHYNDDESTAPERITSCRVAPVRTESSKLTVEDVLAAAPQSRGDVHEPQPGVLTISNPTEFGTVYKPADVRAISAAAHEAGYRVHVDGARFANAVAALDCEPREISSDAGVDALSFGGTKNGLGCGEAVCFFPQGDRSVFDRAVASFEYHRKSTGHLLSKHRFVSAPFAATISDGSWLCHAAHANDMARRLSDGLVQLGLELRYPTEANGVFVMLPEVVDEHLRRAGHAYYQFGEPAWRMFRFMCSFDTSEAEINGLLGDVASALRAARV